MEEGRGLNEDMHTVEEDYKCRQVQKPCINISTQRSMNNENDQREKILNMSSERFPGYQNIIYSCKTILHEPALKRMSVILSHNDTYSIIQLIGEGVYGEVTCCRKRSTGQFVAIKTLKHDGCIASEIRMLKLFQNVDTNKFHIVQFLECFHSNGRSYLVFELLEQNLLDFQKTNNFAPLPAKTIRIIAIQLLRALVKLKELSIIHTDIKPDNIMLVEHKRYPFRIKVIDFGSASILPEVQHISNPYIQARCYRSPEILLGLPFCEKLDMWSLGCVLAELRLGRPLFPGKNQYDQIRMIVEAQGQPKDHLLNQASKARLFFKRNSCPYSTHQWRLKSLSEYEANVSMTVLEQKRQALKSLDQLETFSIIQTLFPNDDNMAEFHDGNVMVALLKRMLNFDPKDRISPGTALSHPFITMEQLKKNYNHTKYYQLSVQGLDAALNYGGIESKKHNYQLCKATQCTNTMHIENIRGQPNHNSNLAQTTDKVDNQTIGKPERIQGLKKGTLIEQTFNLSTEDTICQPYLYQETCHQVSWRVHRPATEFTLGNPTSSPQSHTSRSDQASGNMILANQTIDKDRSTIKLSETIPSMNEGQRNRINNSGKYSTRSSVTEATFLQQETQNGKVYRKETAVGRLFNPNARRNNFTSSKISTNPKSSSIKIIVRRENMELTLGLLDPVQNYSSCDKGKQYLEAGMQLDHRPNSISTGQCMAQLGFTENKLILTAPEEERLQLKSENAKEARKNGNRRIRPRVGDVHNSGIILCKPNNFSVLGGQSMQESEDADLENIHLNLGVKRHKLGLGTEMGPSLEHISESEGAEEKATADKNSHRIFKLAKFRNRSKKIQKKKNVGPMQ